MGFRGWGGGKQWGGEGGGTLVHVGYQHAGGDRGDAAAAEVGAAGVVDGGQGGVEARDDVVGGGPVEELLVDEVGGGEAGDDGGLPVGLEVVVGVGGGVGLGDSEEVICVRVC